MNNRGLTLIELITTLALAAVIITILVNIMLLVKETYTDSEVMTKLLVEQGNLSNVLNSKLTSDSITSYTTCTDSEFCYEFSLKDGNVVKLKVTDKLINFGNYTYKLIEGTTIYNPTLTKQTVSVSSLNTNDSFLNIRIPITNKLYPNKDFGINLVYPYNSRKTSL